MGHLKLLQDIPALRRVVFWCSALPCLWHGVTLLLGYGSSWLTCANPQTPNRGRQGCKASLETLLKFNTE